ncbi:MAG: cytochrome ubiquinol oxidase subunit I [Planctomycetota bacterium]
MDDVLFLSRLQFALTIMFHYIFPPLSIGLGGLMVIMEGAYLRTKNPVWERMARFWTRVFAINFAMGVASGIVMEFQFGTNWATYSRYVGDVFGSALAAEGIFAFFLESGFLAVLVFGWDRVSKRMHFFSTLMVALGALFSSVWIVVANSWQQTPAGFHLVTDGSGRVRAEITDFMAMLFNPSSMVRLAHVVIGAWILSCFFVMSISAWYLLKKRHEEFAKKSFTVALVVGSVFVLLAPITGHFHSEIVAHYQPAKLAAFEGHFKQTGKGADAYIFGIPDEETQEVHYGIAVPGLLSFLVHGDFNAPVTALEEIPESERPPVLIPFITYHIMVSLGGAFIGLSALGLFLWWRRKLWTTRWVLWLFVIAVIGPYLANQAGWVAAEVGRQPYIVYPADVVTEVDGVMQTVHTPGLRTADGLSKSIHADQTLASIVMFGLIYAMLFVVWVYVLNEKIKHGPDEPDAPGEPGEPGAPGAPGEPESKTPDAPPSGRTGFIEAATARLKKE